MKVYIICVCFGICALDLLFRSHERTAFVSAQNWNISKTYKPIEFEWVHRGSFNMSYCSREVINCYESMDVHGVCTYWAKYDSICSAMAQHCNDAHGEHTDYLRGRFEISDHVCTYWWASYYWS